MLRALFDVDVVGIVWTIVNGTRAQVQMLAHQMRIVRGR